jgi:hypothetical protein
LRGDIQEGRDGLGEVMNELEWRRFPLPEKEGWLRHQ